MPYRRTIIWFTLAMSTLVLRLLLGPAQIEAWYSRGLFLGIRQVVDGVLTSWFPFPLLYALLGWGVIWIGIQLYTLYQRREGIGRKFLRLGLGVVSLLSGVVFFFLLLWGFNYGREDVEATLELPQERISLDTLEARMRAEMQVLTKLRAQIPGADTATLEASVFPKDLERAVRPLLEATLEAYGYPVVGSVRCRTLYPEGVLLRIATAGVYFPWVGEGNIDGGLLPLQQIPTMIHEMAHGYGFGDEGTCTFWAYLASYRSDDPVIAYAGRLGYWRSLASTYRRARNEAYVAYRSSLPKGVVADLDAVNENIRRFPDIFPRVRYAAYDTYLKAQGIKEGMLNYNRVIQLVEAWRTVEQQ